MKKTKSVNIKTATDLWDAFAKASNLQKDFYDKELENQIRKGLKLSDTANIRKSLKTQNISIDLLLFVILTALQPFSQMMCELLRMFVKATAAQGDYNLKIHMDFDCIDDNVLDFDLDNFKQYTNQTKQICQTVETKIPIELWKMTNIYMQDWKWVINLFTEQNDVWQWLQEYQSKDKWPDFEPQKPIMGIPHLDKMTDKCWDIFKFAIAKYRQAYDETKGRQKTIQNECIQNSNDEFWAAEQDCWTYHFLASVAYTATVLHHMSSTNEIKKMEETAEEIANALEKYFANAKMKEIDIVLTVDNLMAILNLPFWKRRYELYSAWVSTQIVDALQDRDIEFHVTDHTLSFSFGGSHIATCTGLCPPLEIWAELRTNAQNLIGKGRKKAVQPDYTLAVAPAEKTDNSVVVIECKQYETPNVKNFRDAVIDYANGRPQAVVMLAGYGVIPQKTYAGIEDEKIKSRMADFSLMRPGSLAATAFKEKLRQSVLDYYRKKATENINYLHPWSNPRESGSIVLSWGKHPRDLDLHLYMKENGKEIAHIFYGQKGKEAEMPYSRLNADVIQGWGPEIITISQWTDADYFIEIHDFSGESKEVSFKVEVRFGQDSLCFQRCYPAKDFRTVFRMNRKGIETFPLFMI